jgi:hypothetical protein
MPFLNLARRSTEDAPGRTRLLAAGISDEDIPSWLARFHELRLECGCVLGARCLAAALLLYPVAWAVLLRPGLSIGAALALWAATAMLAMGIGKAVGIGAARLELRRRLAILERPRGAGNGGLAQEQSDG